MDHISQYRQLKQLLANLMVENRLNRFDFQRGIIASKTINTIVVTDGLDRSWDVNILIPDTNITIRLSTTREDIEPIMPMGVDIDWTSLRAILRMVVECAVLVRYRLWNLRLSPTVPHRIFDVELMSSSIIVPMRGSVAVENFTNADALYHYAMLLTPHNQVIAPNSETKIELLTKYGLLVPSSWTALNGLHDGFYCMSKQPIRVIDYHDNQSIIANPMFARHYLMNCVLIDIVSKPI